MQPLWMWYCANPLRLPQRAKCTDAAMLRHCALHCKSTVKAANLQAAQTIEGSPSNNMPTCRFSGCTRSGAREVPEASLTRRCAYVLMAPRMSFANTSTHADAYMPTAIMYDG